jgi:hypothetical protein
MELVEGALGKFAFTPAMNAAPMSIEASVMFQKNHQDIVYNYVHSRISVGDDFSVATMFPYNWPVSVKCSMAILPRSKIGGDCTSIHRHGLFTS